MHPRSPKATGELPQLDKMPVKTGATRHYLLREFRGLSFFGGEPHVRKVRGKGWCFSTFSSVFPSDVTFLTVDRPSLPHVRQFTVPFRSHSEGSTFAQLPLQSLGISSSVTHSVNWLSDSSARWFVQVGG